MNDNTNVDGKKCSGCEEFKKFNDFYKDTHHPSGYKSECKECNRKRKGAKKFIPVIKNEHGKECSTCRVFKSFDEFHKDKRQLDGHVSKCKECRNSRMKQYYEENKEELLQKNVQYRKENPEKIKKYKEKYYAENQEYIILRERKRWHKNAEKYKKMNKQWRQENAQYLKKWRQENSERIKERKRTYNQSERGRELDFQRKMKRRSYKQKVRFSPIERQQLLERDHWTCQLCGCKVHDRKTGNWNTPNKAHIDHIIPISKGGNSEPNNLQVLCRTCNISKFNKISNTI